MPRGDGVDDTESGPAEGVHHLPSEEGNRTGEEDPLPGERHGPGRERPLTLVGEGTCARRRKGYNSDWTFCGHGANKVHRLTSTCTKGCRRWVCKSYTPKRGELR